MSYNGNWAQIQWAVQAKWLSLLECDITCAHGRNLLTNMFKAESAAWNVVRLQWSLYDLRLTSNASWIQDVFHIGSCNLKRFVFWVQDSADVFHQFQPLLLALPNIQDTLAAFLATSCRTSCCTGCQSGWWPIPTSVGGLVVLRVQALGLCQTTGGKSWKWAAVFPRLFWFLFLHWGAMVFRGFSRNVLWLDDVMMWEWQQAVVTGER